MFFAPRRQDRKELNPNFEYRNPKQCQNSNYQNFNLFNSLVLEIGNYVIWICFEFRISCFEFAFLFNLGVLCPVEYRLDQDRVVRQKRYSTGRVIFFPIP